MFTLSQKTTGAIVPVNNGTNHYTDCLLAGETFTVSSNGYQPKDVLVTAAEFNSGFMVVCLDEIVATQPPKNPWKLCPILTALNFSTESEYADILRLFRDAILGTPGGCILVNYYYDEGVQNDLITRLKRPSNALELCRLFIEATPLIIAFVYPKVGACRCLPENKLDEKLANRTIVFLNKLRNEVNQSRTKEALEFACSVLGKSSGKYPGQILGTLITEYQEKTVIMRK